MDVNHKIMLTRKTIHLRFSLTCLNFDDNDMYLFSTKLMIQDSRFNFEQISQEPEP